MDCFVAGAPRKKVGLGKAIATYHRTVSSIRVGPTAGTELAMTDGETSVRDLATRCARIMQEICPSMAEGAGKAGCPVHPQPRVQSRKHTSVVTFTGTFRPSLRNGFTAYFVLSPVIGLFCHRHRRSCLHQLDAGVEASGPHDFAVRNMALSSAAPAASTASRTQRP
jgi:hypothetical protein